MSDAIIHVELLDDGMHHVWWYGMHIGVLLSQPRLDKDWDLPRFAFQQPRTEWNAEFRIIEHPEYKPPPPPAKRRVSTHLGLRRPK